MVTLPSDGALEDDSSITRDPHGQYIIGDAVEELASMDSESAAVVCLDDAWARPGRGGELGVEYPTHDFGVTTEILTECHRVLEPGGWLIADADDWLQPRLVAHLRSEWGDVAATYSGGGFRRSGGVTYLTKGGDPHRGMGEYLTNAGYHVVFAHKSETDRRTSVAARQLARKPTDRYGWGSVKPISPYQNWLNGLCEPGEHITIPCAGTAPAVIAAERIGLTWTAIDSEQGARKAFKRRMDAELDPKQEVLA